MSSFSFFSLSRERDEVDEVDELGIVAARGDPTALRGMEKSDVFERRRSGAVVVAVGPVWVWEDWRGGREGMCGSWERVVGVERLVRRVLR